MATLLVRDAGAWLPIAGSAPTPPMFPDATNTGIPSGTTLLRVPDDVSSDTGWSWSTSNGLVNITGDDVVFSGYSLSQNGIINVTGNGVLIEKCKVNSYGTGTVGVMLREVTGATVQDCEIGGTRTTGGADATGNNRMQFGVKDYIGDSTGILIQRCNFYDTANTISVVSGTIQDNYIHDMGYVVDTDHIDCLIGDGSQGIRILHNTMLNSQSQTSCIALYSQQAATDDAWVKNNYLAGGGYVIYGGDQTLAGTNVLIENNEISTIYWPNGGQFGPLTAFGDSSAGNVWSGNTWADGPNVGQAIP